MSEPLSDAWRLAHVELGDQMLTEATKLMAEFEDMTTTKEETEELADMTRLIQVLVQMAQAHYQAANVRAKPQTSVQIHGLQHELPLIQP